MAIAHSDALSDDRRCVAKAKRTGQRCAKIAMAGLRVCMMHGGATQRSRAAAKRRIAMAEVVQSLGVGVEIEPAEALLKTVYLAAGDVEFLRCQLPEHYTVFTLNASVDRELRVTSFGDGVDVRVKLYNEALERLAKLSKLAIDAGIAERQVRIKEFEAAAMVAVFVKVFDHPTLQLSGPQKATARQLARTFLLEQVNASRATEHADPGQPHRAKDEALSGAGADRGVRETDLSST